MLRYLFFSVIFLFCFTESMPAFADCLKVADDTALKINSDELTKLNAIGIDRAGIFAAMMATAIPETEGCWAGGTGDFDGQLVSVGFAQWNYGQGSLQPILIRYRNSFATTAAFEIERERSMPQYGKLIFSPGCLRLERSEEHTSELQSH